MNLVNAVLREAAARFGGRAAIVAEHDGRVLTYAELDQVTVEVVAGLEQAGVQSGHVVALLVPSSIEYVVAMLAVARMGAIVAGVNTRLPAAARADVLGELCPDVVITTSDLRPDACTVADADIIEVVVGGDPLAGLRGPASRHRRPDCRSRPRMIVFTSGTTGTPKGAVFTDRQLAAIGILDAGSAWGAPGEEATSHLIASTELVHVGFMTKLPWYLRTGLTVHLLPKWRAAHVLDLVEQHRIGALGGVSAQIALLVAEQQARPRDVSSVQQLIVGGGPSTPALVRRASETFGAGYSIRYSSTESGGVGTATAPDDGAAVWSTVGHPRPGIDVRIGGDDRVWLRSPAATVGYWQNPDATAETLVDGWLRTSDDGRLDDDGRLTLLGRVGDSWVRGGYNVHPGPVETAVMSHPGVREAAVVGRDHDVMGAIGVAMIVALGTAPDVEGLRAHLADKLARHEHPEVVVVVDELPRTAMGKIDRAAVRRHINGVG